MGRYVIRRVLQAIPLLFLLSIGMFGLIHLLPGGADAVLFNPRLTAAARAALRVRMGLDDPFYIQYVKWLTSALTGNFGYSFNTNEPVATILARRFPATLMLFVPALTLALVLAILLGVISAVRQGTFSASGCNGFPLQAPRRWALRSTHSLPFSINSSTWSYRCACWQLPLSRGGVAICVQV